jgi:hypothetical protein
MSRLRELVERELVVCACLSSTLCAVRLALHASQRDKGGLSEPPSVWLARAESSLLFAKAELSYLGGPAPPAALPATERVL